MRRVAEGALPLKVPSEARTSVRAAVFVWRSASLDPVSLDSKTVGESLRAAEWEAAGRATAVFPDSRSSGHQAAK